MFLCAVVEDVVVRLGPNTEPIRRCTTFPAFPTFTEEDASAKAAAFLLRGDGAAEAGEGLDRPPAGLEPVVEPVVEPLDRLLRGLLLLLNELLDMLDMLELEPVEVLPLGMEGEGVDEMEDDQLLDLGVGCCSVVLRPLLVLLFRAVVWLGLPSYDKC